jgi:hypothetical protein
MSATAVAPHDILHHLGASLALIYGVQGHADLWRQLEVSDRVQQRGGMRSPVRLAGDGCLEGYHEFLRPKFSDYAACVGHAAL